MGNYVVLGDDKFMNPSSLQQEIFPDYNNQQFIGFRIENRTTDPSSPTVGQIWLRIDL